MFLICVLDPQLFIFYYEFLIFQIWYLPENFKLNF